LHALTEKGVFKVRVSCPKPLPLMFFCLPSCIAHAQNAKITIDVTACPQAQIAKMIKQVAAKQALPDKLLDCGDFSQSKRY